MKTHLINDEDNLPLVAAAIEHLFKIEGLVNNLFGGDEGIGQLMPIWIVDNPGDDFQDKVNMFSTLANYSDYIYQDKHGSAVAVLFPAKIAGNYYGVFVPYNYTCKLGFNEDSVIRQINNIIEKINLKFDVKVFEV
jgi:hypothetical protein